jgi:endoglycosylceramidase
MHGVNAVYKQPPFIPDIYSNFSVDESFDDQDVKDLEDWGMNVVRLGVMWDGVETAPGVYN